jgi:subtilisin family serine protease
MSTPNRRVQKPSNQSVSSRNELAQNTFAAMLFMDQGSFIQFDRPHGNGSVHVSPASAQPELFMPLFENSGFVEGQQSFEQPLQDNEQQVPDDASCLNQDMLHVNAGMKTDEWPCPRMLVQIETSADGSFSLRTPTERIEPLTASFVVPEIANIDQTLADIFGPRWMPKQDVPVESYADVPAMFQQAQTTALPVNTQWSAVSGWGQINLVQALESIDAPLTVSPSPSSGSATSYLYALGFATAWANGYTGQGVVIANIDTGFDFNNTFLTPGINFSAYNWNFITDSSNVQDDNGHGTMTAAEMVADPTTGFGVCGAAYDAQLMVLKALDANGKGLLEDVCEAIYYAVDHGAHVINMSLGQALPNTNLQAALQYAADHDVVVVAAAGNGAAHGPDFPAAYGSLLPNVMAVGAAGLTATGCEMASFSNQAGSDQAYNYVTANGADMLGFGLHNNLWSWSGTSFSAPLVAAQAAILESANQALTADQIIQAITNSADHVDAWFDRHSTQNTLVASSNTHVSASEWSLMPVSSDFLNNQFPVEPVY